MKTATLLADDVGGYAGPTHLYQLSEPLEGFDYVTVCVEETFVMQIKDLRTEKVSVAPPQAGQVCIFPAYESGAPVVLRRLSGSYTHSGAAISPADTRQWALMMAGGYEIVVPDPVVDDSPAEFDEPTTLEPLALEKAEPEVAEVIRVHELAKELGIGSAELLAKLAEYGSTITSASANVDHDTAQIMRGIYAEGE